MNEEEPLQTDENRWEGDAAGEGDRNRGANRRRVAVSAAALAIVAGLALPYALMRPSSVEKAHESVGAATVRQDTAESESEGSDDGEKPGDASDADALKEG